MPARCSSNSRRKPSTRRAWSASCSSREPQELRFFTQDAVEQGDVLVVGQPLPVARVVGRQDGLQPDLGHGQGLDPVVEPGAGLRGPAQEQGHLLRIGPRWPRGPPRPPGPGSPFRLRPRNESTVLWGMFFHYDKKFWPMRAPRSRGNDPGPLCFLTNRRQLPRADVRKAEGSPPRAKPPPPAGPRGGGRDGKTTVDTIPACC